MQINLFAVDVFVWYGVFNVETQRASHLYLAGPHAFTWSAVVQGYKQEVVG